MKANQSAKSTKNISRRRAFGLVFVVAITLLFGALSVNATTFYSTYGQTRTQTVNLTGSGTHTFEVDGIASYKNTEWYVKRSSDADYVYKETDNSGILAFDPDYSYAFSSGTTLIKAIVYNSAWTVLESHIWTNTIDTTAPSIPSLSSPATGSATSDNTVSLDWDNSSDPGTGVNSYEVQVDDSSTFNSVNYTFTPSSSSATTSALADALWYWRVRAKDNAGNWSSYSLARTFRVDTTPPSTPGTITISGVTSTGATMSWGTSSDAGGSITYVVEYGVNNTLGWTSAGTTAGTSNTFSSLNPDTTYVVRVRARDVAGNYSSWNQQDPAFTTPPLNRAPSIPGAITISGLTRTGATVNWGASSDSDGNPITYEIEYGVNNTVGWTPAGTTTSTSKTLSDLNPNTTYVVRVRARDNFNPIAYSDWNQKDPAFTTLVNNTPTQPGTITPSSVTSNSASIAWIPSTDSDGDTVTYEVQYGVNNTLGWTAAGTTAGTTSSLTSLQAETTYVVRVRASDGKGGVSSWRQLDPAFTTSPVRGILSAYWLAPNYVIEGTNATMRAQVTGYSVGDQFAFEIREDDGILSPNDNVTTNYGNVYSSAGILYVDATWTTAWQPDQSSDPEFYFIVSRGGTSLQSSTADADEMHVSQGPVLSLNLTSLSPSVTKGQNASSQSIDVWNSGNGTLNYTITVNPGANWLSVNPASGISTSEHDPIAFNYTTTGLSVGTHTATITATASGAGGSPQAITVSLTVISVASPGTPSGPNPANGAVLSSQPLKLDWANTSGAESYDVYLKLGSGAFTKVGSDLAVSEWSPIQNYAATEFSWYVVAKNAGGPTTGPTWSFSISATAPGTPSGPSPADGAVLSSQPLKLDWENTTGAESYDVYLKLGCGAFNKVGSDLAVSVWSPNQSYAVTSFSWYVVAKNAGGTTTGPIWSYCINVVPSGPFYLTHFPVCGKGLSDPIINSVFDHITRGDEKGVNIGEIYVFSGEHAQGPRKDKGDYPSTTPLRFKGRRPDFPGGNLVAYDNHFGIDYKSAVGDPVIAAAGGEVTAFYDHSRSAPNRGDFKRDCGNYVEITHAGGFMTRYLHLSVVDSKINKGLQIGGGNPLGNSGRSGGETAFVVIAVDPHLHFNLFKNIAPSSSAPNWQRIDPYGWNDHQKEDPHPRRAYHPWGGYWAQANQCSVIGYVLDASGGPVAGVMVNLESTVPLTKDFASDDTAVSALHTVTSETGEYRFGGIPNGATYTVSATAPMGSSVSSPQTFTAVSGDLVATFSVSSLAVLPSVSRQPQSIAVTVGEPVSFFVEVAGSGPFAYQWRKGGAPIPGETSAELSIAAVTVADDGSSFDAVVSNPGGSVTTIAAVLSLRTSWNISGNVKYFSSGIPVPGVSLTLSGAVQFSTLTASNGSFTISNVPTGEYVLTPSKTNDVTAISAYDLHYARRIMFGVTNSTPERDIAADVNRSGGLTTLDLVLIRRIMSGLTTLKAVLGPVSEWQFTPSQRTYSLLNGDQMNQDFTAVLIGDVSGNWSPTAPELLGQQGGIAGPMPNAVTVATDGGPPGSASALTARVLLRPSTNAVAHGIDAVLRYSPTNRSLGAITSGRAAGPSGLTTNTNEPGRIRLYFEGSSTNLSLVGTSTLFTVDFPGSEPVAWHIERMSFNKGLIPFYVESGVASFDADGDGLIDADEVELFHSNPHSRDSDGDGMLDRDEIRAGTNPNSSASTLVVRSAVINPDGTLMLTWPSVPGKRYRIEFKSRLDEAAWAEIGNIIDASDSTTSAVIEPVSSANLRVFRVKLVE